MFLADPENMNYINLPYYFQGIIVKDQPISIKNQNNNF